MKLTKKQQKKFDAGLCIRCGLLPLVTTKFCRGCQDIRNTAVKKFNEKNPERRKQQKNKWKKNNPEKVKAWMHSPQRKKYWDNYYRLHRDRIIAYSKSHYLQNRVSIANNPLKINYPYCLDASGETDLIKLIDSFVPKNLCNQDRADICQSLILAVLSGEIKTSDLQIAARQYAKDFYKLFPRSWGHKSLDATIFDDNNLLTLADTISSDSAFDYNPPIYKTRYGYSFSHSESAEELADKLRNRWEANALLTTDRRQQTARIYSAANRPVIENVNHQTSGKFAMSRKIRQLNHLKIIDHSKPAKIAHQEMLDEAVLDYLELRVVQESQN